MQNDIQFQNFKEICHEMYGSNDNMTKALKSAIRNPNESVRYGIKSKPDPNKYNGRWSYQKGIRTCKLDRIFHKIKLYFSKAYQTKFNKATKALYLAIKVHQIRPDHSARVLEINNLEKNRIFHEDAINSLSLKKNELKAQAEQIKKDLERVDQQLDNYCQESNIIRPTPIKNRCRQDEVELANSGITDQFLLSYKKVDDKIKAIANELKKNPTLIEIERKKAELNNLEKERTQLNKKFFAMERPERFKYCSPLKIEKHLYDMKFTAVGEEEIAKQHEKYREYKIDFENLKTAHEKCVQDSAKFEESLKNAEAERLQFKKEIKEYVDSIVGEEQKI